MSFMQAVRSAYRNYANFSGRALRSEFWWLVAFLVLTEVALLAVGGVLGRGAAGIAGIAFFAYGIFILASLIPYLAVAVRRLHDRGHSGWWLLLSFIPFGGLVLLILFCLEGTPGMNRFGPPSGSTGRTSRYAGSTIAEAMQRFNEDAQHAWAAGYRPTGQQWLQYEAWPTLEVTYQRFA